MIKLGWLSIGRVQNISSLLNSIMLGASIILYILVYWMICSIFNILFQIIMMQLLICPGKLDYGYNCLIIAYHNVGY